MIQKDRNSDNFLTGEEVRVCLSIAKIHLSPLTVSRLLRSSLLEDKGHNIEVIASTLQRSVHLPIVVDPEEERSEKWNIVLDLYDNLFEDRSPTTTEEAVEAKSRLTTAMSEHSRFEAGFLPALDVVQLSLAYCTVLGLSGVDTGHIRQAVNIARWDIETSGRNINKITYFFNSRSNKIHRGMVSTEVFLHHLFSVFNWKCSFYVLFTELTFKVTRPTVDRVMPCPDIHIYMWPNSPIFISFYFNICMIDKKTEYILNFRSMGPQVQVTAAILIFILLQKSSSPLQSDRSSQT